MDNVLRARRHLSRARELLVSFGEIGEEIAWTRQAKKLLRNLEAPLNSTSFQEAFHPQIKNWITTDSDIPIEVLGDFLRTAAADQKSLFFLLAFIFNNLMHRSVNTYLTYDFHEVAEFVDHLVTTPAIRSGICCFEVFIGESIGRLFDTSADTGGGAGASGLASLDELIRIVYCVRAVVCDVQLTQQEDYECSQLWPMSNKHITVDMLVELMKELLSHNGHVQLRGGVLTEGTIETVFYIKDGIVTYEREVRRPDKIVLVCYDSLPNYFA